MPKVNVYLPAELAREVKESGIGLSPVCQAALRAEVLRARTTTAEASDLEAVAERLILTEKLDADRDYLEGHDVGREWARDAASLRELRAVSRHGAGDWGRVIDLRQLAPSLMSFLMHRYADRDPEVDWFDHLDIDRAFDRGLVEGATGLYEAVLPLLDLTP